MLKNYFEAEKKISILRTTGEIDDQTARGFLADIYYYGRDAEYNISKEENGEWTMKIAPLLQNVY